MAEGSIAGATASDDKLDEILRGLQRWSDEERRQYIEGSSEEHPLFLTAQPTVSDLDSNSTLSALANAAYDEFDTPFSLAHECKTKGNEAFARGSEFYGHAIRHYNEALQHIDGFYRHTGCTPENKFTPTSKRDASAAKDIRSLEAAVYGNLSAIYLARNKFITALDCAKKALQITPNNVKVLFRAARCCLEMGRAQAGINFCDLALTFEPESAAINALLRECNKQRAVQLKREDETRLEHVRRAQQIAEVRKAVKQRGMRVGPPLFKNMRRTLAYPFVHREGPADTDDGVLMWPVLLLYPQYSQSDWLDEVSEVSPLSDVLEFVLSSRPPWDTRGEYVPSNCDIFYVSNPCKPSALESAWQDYVDGAAESAVASAVDADAEIDWSSSPKFIRVPPAAPMLFPLVQSTYITADIPVFYVVARSSETYAEMLSRAGGVFPELRVPELPPPPA